MKKINCAAISAEQPYNKELLTKEWPKGFENYPQVCGCHIMASRICKNEAQAVAFLERVRPFRDEHVTCQKNATSEQPITVYPYSAYGWKAYARIVGEFRLSKFATEVDSEWCRHDIDPYRRINALAVAWVPQQLN